MVVLIGICGQLHYAVKITYQWYVYMVMCIYGVINWYLWSTTFCSKKFLSVICIHSGINWYFYLLAPIVSAIYLRHNYMEVTLSNISCYLGHILSVIYQWYVYVVVLISICGQLYSAVKITYQWYVYMLVLIGICGLLAPTVSATYTQA